MPTFRHGKNTAVFVDQYDLQQFLNQATMSASADTAETSAFGQGAKTYVVGLRDAQFSVGGMFDGTTGAIDQVMSTIASVDTPNSITYAPEGLSATGVRAQLLAANDTSYEVTSPISDVVSVAAQFQGTGGCDYGFVLTPRTVFNTAATTNGTSIDNLALTSNGGVAHLHVTGNTRDGATTVIVQHSADNTTFTTLASFTAVSAASVSGQRVVVATGTTVNRYVRAQVTVAGTTGSVTATVAFARR